MRHFRPTIGICKTIDIHRCNKKMNYKYGFTVEPLFHPRIYSQHVAILNTLIKVVVEEHETVYILKYFIYIVYTIEQVNLKSEYCAESIHVPIIYEQLMVSNL